MNTLWSNWLLLADESRWKDLGGGFRGEQAELSATEVVTTLLLLIGAAAVVWFLSHAARKQEPRRLYNNPRHLFKSLCRAHALSGSEARLLVQMAGKYQLARPAQLFLEPERFDGESLPGSLKPHQESIEQLKLKLFST